MYNVTFLFLQRAQSNQYPAIIDMIQTDNPMVANSLIDQRGVECILLIESGKDARQVMDPDNQPGPPRHATEVCSFDLSLVTRKPVFGLATR